MAEYVSKYTGSQIDQTVERMESVYLDVLDLKTGVLNLEDEKFDKSGGTISGDTMIGGNVYINHSFLSAAPAGTNRSVIKILPNVPYSLIEPNHNTEAYYKELIKWICRTYPNDTYTIYIGSSSPNSGSMVFIYIYDNSDVNGDGFPRYSMGMSIEWSEEVTLRFSTNVFNWYFTSLRTTSNTITVAEGGTGVTTNAAIGLKAYPVNSIYMSVNSTSPASLFGGTWVQLKDRFLLGAGSSYSNGATGGAATHTLTTTEMPEHTHNTDSGGLIYTTKGSYSAEITGVASGSPFNENTSAGGMRRGSNAKTGGDGAHNNMPPYLVVYMWKRTA